VSFQVNDVVICDRVRGHVGTIAALKKLRGLALVVWNRNFRSWVDVESLEPAGATRPTAPRSGGPGPWFDRREVMKWTADKGEVSR
jgi:hypothetical protein